ncbi:MAG: ATP-binding cassette domain-containing protein [Proteobacteria bacterium]|nr:ATP-binding cassette domain-containing protein [Pseudomonadota bacterium]
MSKEIKIITEKLHFAYQGRAVLEDIDLTLLDNSIIAVTGPSGTGKSTLLSVFNRLWEESSDGVFAGQVLIRLSGRLVDIYGPELPVDALRRKVGMVFQIPNPLPMTIFKNIAFPLMLKGLRTKSEVAGMVETMLTRVHLFDEVKDRLNHDARSLSGGQQQRLCIARALMVDPEVLLLDEPTSSLDSKASEKIEDLLVELKEKCTLLMVSHYQDQVRRIADEVYELADRQLYRMS